MKQQIAASMHLNISVEVSGRMSLPEFREVQEIGQEIIKEEAENRPEAPLPPGVMGRARIR